MKLAQGSWMGVVALSMVAALDAQDQPQEFDVTDGLAIDGEEIWSGRFEGRQRGDEFRIRRFTRAKKPRLKNAVLVVDGEKRIVFNRIDSESALYDEIVRLVEHEETMALLQAQSYWAFYHSNPDFGAELKSSLLEDVLRRAPGHKLAWGPVGELEKEPRLAFLARIAEEHPRHGSVEAAVRALLPAEAPSFEPFPARSWIEFLQLELSTPTRILVDPDAKDAEGQDYRDERNWLGTSQKTKVWNRPDVVGYRSERIFLLTPVPDPAAVGRLLQLGESALSFLDALFLGETVERKHVRYPLVVKLFEDKKEYDKLGRSVRTRGLSKRHAHTAGNYDRGTSPPESRLYVQRKKGGEQDMFRTLVHELTHHWVSLVCPMFTNEQAVAAESKPESSDRPGHWIVEGFASMVEEMPLSLASEASANRSRRIDTVANAKSAQLVPWAKLFGCSRSEFHELDLETKSEVPITWDKKRVRLVTETGFFYAQSATAAWHLYLDPETRPKLLAYVAAYYRGDVDNLDVEKVFGVSAAQLGKRAVARAQALRDTWKPAATSGDEAR